MANKTTEKKKVKETTPTLVKIGANNTVSSRKGGITRVSAVERFVNVPDGIQKQAEYLEYVTFMALPEVLRQEIMGITKQKDFAESYGLREATLSDWKYGAGFWDNVAKVRQHFFRGRTANVLLALETKNLNPETVTGNDVKVLLTYTGEYKERTVEEHTVDPELQRAIAKMGQVLD